MKLMNGCLSLAATLMFTACGGGGASTPPAVTGAFIDDPVEGLGFRCSSGAEGTTTANGEYTCYTGDDVTFSIGAATIGTIAAQEGIVTPYLLFPDNVAAAINLARLIQSMDGDGDAFNGAITLDANLSARVPAATDFASASFEAEVETALSVELVDDTEAVERMNAAIIEYGGTVPDGGHIPVAEAGGDRVIGTNVSVTLDGSGSFDADGDTLTYLWSITDKPEASVAALSDGAAVTPTFTPDVDGVYVLSLVVNDGRLNSAADTVILTASTPNIVPVANAGADQNVNTDSTVTLDGNGSSDGNGEPLTYSWRMLSRPAGSNASLNDPASISPTFFADMEGRYVVELIVNDGTDDSLADTVAVRATTDFAPTANVGADRKVYYTDSVTFDGTLSSDDGTIVSYEWKEGSTVLSTAESFIYSGFTVGTHTVTLTVTDDIGQTASDSVEVIVFDDFTDILPMRDTGIKLISSSGINGVTTTTVSSGSQMFFTITNDLSRDFRMTKFEIIRTYNGYSTVTAQTTDIAGILGNNTLSAGENVTLGYTLSTNETANYWTARYYLTDIATGETFTNSYVWNGTVFH